MTWIIRKTFDTIEDSDIDIDDLKWNAYMLQFEQFIDYIEEYIIWEEIPQEVFQEYFILASTYYEIQEGSDEYQDIEDVLHAFNYNYELFWEFPLRDIIHIWKRRLLTGICNGDILLLPNRDFSQIMILNKKCNFVSEKVKNILIH